MAYNEFVIMYSKKSALKKVHLIGKRYENLWFLNALVERAERYYNNVKKGMRDVLLSPTVLQRHRRRKWKNLEYYKYLYYNIVCVRGVL